MKNKKGATFTLKHILNLLLAVIVVMMLIYLGIRLTTTKTKLEQARATLDSIVEHAELLEEGETKKLVLEGPKEWMILESGSNLCACENKIAKDYQGADRFQACSRAGVCLEVQGFEIEVFTSISETAYLNLDNAPFDIYLRKEGNKIEVFEIPPVGKNE